MSTDLAALAHRLDLAVQAVEDIPSAKMDEEDQRVREGLLLIAQSHRAALSPNALARMPPSARELLFTQITHFCDEVQAMVVEGHAQDD